MIKKVYLFLVSLVFLCLFTSPAFAQDIPSITARAHVENVGWQDVATDENHHMIIGSQGQGLRLEAFTLQTSDPNLGIRYQSHVQDVGWQDPVENGQVSGTEGQKKNIEALCIQLTGENAPNYNLYYRTHVQNYGWLDWTSNFGAAGTTTHNFRCEAIELVLYPKDTPAPGPTITPAIQATSPGEAQHMYQVNKLRKAHNLNYVTGDPNLKAVADLRLQEILQKYSHIRPNGQSYETAVKSVFPNYPAPGGGIIENICFGGTRIADPVSNFTVYTHYSQDTEVLLQESARYLSWTSTIRGQMGYAVTLLSGLDRIDFADY